VGAPRDTAGGHPRHNAERYACARQRLCLFAAAAEHKRIAALQPQHALAFLRQFHQQVGYFVLLAALHPGALAGIDLLGIRKRQQMLVHQRVEQNHVGLGECLQAQGRDKAGIARARAHQPDPTSFQARQIEFFGEFLVHSRTLTCAPRRGTAWVEVRAHPR
jgi:hypothetical protein